MNKTNLTVATKADASKLIKPKFGPGMLLRAEDLDLLKDYTRDLSRLMFRSLFGCGVVCGLKVKVYEDCGMVVVEVGSGLAIACSGDPIYIPKDVTFPLHDDCHEATAEEEVWVILCSKAKCCGPRTSICASDEDDSPTECTRERDWYEIRVVTSPPECVCSCLEKPAEVDNTERENAGEAAGDSAASAEAEDDDNPCKCATGPCYADHYAGLCKCHCGKCSDCECKCVLLASAKRVGETEDWDVDHSVRRFVRPVLMRDPVPLEKPKPLAFKKAAMKGTVGEQSVNQAAFQAAEESIRTEAEKAAKAAAQAKAQELAKEIGERAAELVVKQVAEEVAQQAAKEAIAEQRTKVNLDAASVKEAGEQKEKPQAEKIDAKEGGGPKEAGPPKKENKKEG